MSWRWVRVPLLTPQLARCECRVVDCLSRTGPRCCQPKCWQHLGQGPIRCCFSTDITQGKGSSVRRQRDDMLHGTAAQVLRSLAFLHSLGLIHSDLKPENILIKSYSRSGLHPLLAAHAATRSGVHAERRVAPCARRTPQDAERRVHEAASWTETCERVPTPGSLAQRVSVSRRWCARLRVTAT